MHGTDVLTVDDEKIGHVVEERDGYVIVEHGLLKHKHAIPRTFVETDGEVLRTTLSKQIVHESPKVNGDDLDVGAVAEHYGLAEGHDDPPTRGSGDVLPQDPAGGADDHAQERVKIRQGLTSGHGDLDRGESPGLTGGDRYKDYPRD